ncbi:MAG: hypothetical protein RLZZ196_897 [Bacteroidota bacterium]|jgi:hypothetical protein
MRDKAIFFTAYNRIQYLIPTLEQWKKVEDISLYDIYFKVEPSEIVETVMDQIHKFKNDVNTDVYIILNHEIQGCARNTWNGFNELFDKYNFVILTEDDILPSSDVCKYFNFLERKYRDDNSVAVISANYEFEGYSPYSVSKVDIFRGQIWGTWKNRWENYIKDTWDFDYSTSENNGPSGWDWNLTLRVLPKNNLKTIVPHSSRSQHIGVVGLHCDQEIFDSTQMKSFKPERAWKDLVEV